MELCHAVCYGDGKKLNLLRNLYGKSNDEMKCSELWYCIPKLVLPVHVCGHMRVCALINVKRFIFNGNGAHTISAPIEMSNNVGNGLLRALQLGVRCVGALPSSNVKTYGTQRYIYFFYFHIFNNAQNSKYQVHTKQQQIVPKSKARRKKKCAETKIFRLSK